jgi:hypothetical protein
MRKLLRPRRIWLGLRGICSNVIGAFGLGVSFLTASSAALREQGRLGDLARALFAQAWAEMEVGDWMGAMGEAEESVRFAEETGEALWVAAATIVKAKLAGMQGNLEQSEAYAAQAERLVLSIGVSATKPRRRSGRCRRSRRSATRARRSRNTWEADPGPRIVLRFSVVWRARGSIPDPFQHPGDRVYRGLARDPGGGSRRAMSKACARICALLHPAVGFAFTDQLLFLRDLTR